MRRSFEGELRQAERAFLDEGNLVQSQLGKVIDALGGRDLTLAREVVAGDERVDDLYLATDARILSLIALQAPVAGDLRLISALMHSNLHLERIGDLCVNIAKFVLNDHDYPVDSTMMTALQEMGTRAGELLRTALVAFLERDTELAERLPDHDDTLDRLNREMLHRLKAYAQDDESFEWALKLLLVARYLERIGDHAVDIGEQVAFISTGVFREFTDASTTSPYEEAY